MTGTTLTCPGCFRHLTTKQIVPAGVKVVCPQCKTPFLSPQPTAPTPAPVRPTPARPAAPAPVAVPPPNAPEPARRGPLLLIAAGVGAFLFLGIGLAVVYAVVQAKRGGPVAVSPTTAPVVPPTTAPGDDPDDNHLEPIAAAARVTPEQQKKIDEAIDKGLAFLKRTQNAEGSWGKGQPLGHAALGGLVLLECGLPANNPHVAKSTAFVRKHAAAGAGTYAIALSILFLDRLGDPQDKKLIQSLALQLIAGQRSSGGWSYKSGNLTPQEEKDLLALLEQTRPRSSADLFMTGATGGPAPMGAGNPDDPTEPDKLGPVKSGDDPFRKLGGPAAPAPALTAAQVKNVSNQVKQTPAIRPLLPPESQPPKPPQQGEATDNSNTQFALLAVWVATRHGVPTERCLALVDRRFRTSQDPDGNWAYQYFEQPKVAMPNRGSAAMNCAGLLGLAVGHGANDRVQKDGGNPPVRDPMIERGLKRLGAILTTGKKGQKTTANLYFLWSLERVAVLYNLETIQGFDWYAAGSAWLVQKQLPSGAWHVGGFAGSSEPIDTCFALLFLKRANVAKDLTRKLETLVDIKDLGGR